MALPQATVDALRAEAEDRRTLFLRELEGGTGWVACKGNDHVRLSYRIDKASPLKMFRISAVVPCRMQALLDALLVPKHRVKWELLVDGMRDIAKFDGGCSMHYITTRPVAGGLVARRDFVHVRRVFDTPLSSPDETDAKTVVDFSCEHPDYPPNKHHVRATTLFCATVFRERRVDGRYETSYESITQSDIRGCLPPCSHAQGYPPSS